MNKLGKAVLAVVIAVSLSLPFIANFRYSDAVNDFSREKYIADLTSIYKEYNTDIESKDKTDPLALNRIVVMNYDGKLYGSVKRAWDRENKIGILQYDSRDNAETALKKIKAEGKIADGDGVATLVYEDEVISDFENGVRKSSSKGTIHPDGSNYLGTTQFINKINMNIDDIIVAVIDTGVMYDHTAIADRFYSHGYDLSSDGAADAYYDTSLNGEYYGHATMVSGIIADNTPDNVKILPFKVVPFGGTYATISAMVAGINSAVSMGASVISMSLSAASSKAIFENCIENAKNHGVTLCSSAGNTGEEISSSPANVEDNITVSALDGDEIASFSSYGSTVDFTAQGRRIRSTFPLNGTSGYARGSGTSFSTPYVAACCADIKCLNKDMSWDDVYNTLVDFAVDLGEEGCDDYYGYGAPYLGDIEYSNSVYTLKVPEGTLEINETQDYTAETQPWKKFAPNLIQVSVNENIERIGDYAFCNMKNAEFEMRETYKNVGEYAFYGCEKLKNFTFDIDVERVGYGAFSNIEDFFLSGYRNTPAERCAIHDNLVFNALGCKHDYYYEVVDPTKTEEGYTIYTCSVCGDSYIGEYIPPNVIKTGVCGANMTFTVYDTGKLTLSGEGDMYNYLYSAAPWKDYKNIITKVYIDDNVNELSPFAFYGCSKIKKFTVSEDNEYYYQNTQNLIKKDGNQLVLAIANGNYEIPENVEYFNSTAFIFNMPAKIETNDNFTCENDIIYDENKNVVMALNDYKDETFTFTSNSKICKYAFLFCEYPNTVYCDWNNAVVEDYGIGYIYNGSLVRRDLTFYTGTQTKAYLYATRKGFTVNTEDCGKCGDDMNWRYNIDEDKLTVVGNGDMYTYSQKSDVPWEAYLSTVKTVVIGNGVTYISPYAFYRAVNLKNLTMPVSVRAPENDKTWQGCTTIKTLNITLGSGVSDDYGTDSNSQIYTYTPWYYSRNSINSFTLDENVKYIGKYMFRNCLAIHNLTFNCVEEIADHAFVACTNLKSVTNYCKTTLYHDYSLFSYQFGSVEEGIYENKTLYAYADSTSKDYSDTNVINFVSLGCGHSRSTHFVRDGQTGCFEIGTIYYCDDCESEYAEDSVYWSAPQYNLRVKAVTLKNKEISNADVYINGFLFGKTDSKGEVSGKAVFGVYPIEIRVGSAVLYSGEIDIPENDVCAVIKFRYGNYNGDGAVNGKDFSISMKNKNNDKELFDYGKVEANENQITISEI